jgi:hypothetical protein
MPILRSGHDTTMHRIGKPNIRSQVPQPPLPIEWHPDSAIRFPASTGPSPSTPFMEAYQARDLASVWPDADVQVIPDAGHAPSDPAIAAAVEP